MTVGQRRGGANRHVVAVALLTVYVAWGATYPAIRVLDRTVPPLTGMGARFLCAGALLLGGIAIVAPRRLRAGLRPVAGSVAAGVWILGDIGLIAWAEQHVDAGLAALVIASVPLWVVLTRAVTGSRPIRLEVAAVVVGFVGLLVLLRPGSGVTGLGWMLLLVLAALIEATGEVASQRMTQPPDSLVATVYQLLGAGAVLVLAGAARGEMSAVHPGDFGAATMGAFAFLVLPGSALAYAAFVWLLANAPVQLTATYAYVNPVVAVVLGAVLLGERIDVVTVAGAVLVLASVAAVVRAQSRPREPVS